MLDILPQQIVNGLALGSTYALVALGLTLIFGVLLIPNFAHGEFYMLGAFAAYTLIAVGVNFWLAVVLAVLIVAAIGPLLDRIVFVPLAQASSLSLMVAALASSIILQQIATLIWGTEPRTIQGPLNGVLRTGYFSITHLQLLIIATMLVAWCAVWLILNHSRLGLAVRAVAQNRDAAALMGISMPQVRVVVFVIGGALGALAGALLGASYPIYPTMGANPVLKAFVVLVLGGVGSMMGAIIGGLVLGIVEVMVAGYISGELQDIGAFVILVAILLLRPQGLFGREQVER